jgi:hypothetical protein
MLIRQRIVVDRTDAEPPTQLATVDALLLSKPNKLKTLIHGTHFFPRHVRTPSFVSCQKCQPCLRTLVSYAPGLNNKHEDNNRA